MNNDYFIQSGPRDAKIMVVGEAPTSADLQARTPFQGGAGQLLSHAMSRSGISLSQCFQTYVLHIAPPGGIYSKLLSKASQVDYMRGVIQLKKDIETIRPAVVIALGAGALQALTGKSEINKYRGSILESILVKGQKVIGTFSAIQALMIYEMKTVMEIDFAKCLRQSGFNEIRLPKREMILNPDPSRRIQVMYEMLRSPWLSIDIECRQNATTGEWTLSCVGFADSAHRAMTIEADSPEAIQIIRLLCKSNSKKIFQNGMFDISVLADSGIEVNGFDWDTMFSLHTLLAEAASGEDEMSRLSGKKRTSVFRKGLGFQVSIYTDEPYYKDDSKVDFSKPGSQEEFWLYNAKDAAVTYEIKEAHERELIEAGTMAAFQRKMRAGPALIAMMRRGILIDMVERARLKEMYEEEIKRLQDFLDSAAGEPVNVKSAPQIKDLLFNKLRLPVKYNRKTGRMTGSKDAIIELNEKIKNPVLTAILKIRERRDYLERYINAKVDADNRIRCSFDPTGTKSDRLSSRQSIYGSGTNLQTIPSRKRIGTLIKRMFLADPGKVFIYRDYSQAEARVVAYLARCQGLIELFEDPSRDIHKENAARIFMKALDQITPAERYLAKKAIHASNYGIGPEHLMQSINEDSETTGITIDRRRAGELIEKYFYIYPEIRSVFWRDVENEVKRTRTLSTPMGQKRSFYGRMDDKLLREAYSYIPQATVGAMGVEALANCYEQIELGRPDLGAEVLLNVHDSILMQCNEDKWEETSCLMSQCMNIPLTVHGREFHIPTDLQVGKNWAKKSEANPDGLSSYQE